MSLKQFFFPTSFDDKKKQEIANYIFTTFCFTTTGLTIFFVILTKLQILMNKMPYFTVGMLITGAGAFAVACLSFRLRKKAQNANNYSDLKVARKTLYFYGSLLFLCPGIIATAFLQVREMLFIYAIFLGSAFCCYQYDWKILSKMEKDN